MYKIYKKICPHLPLRRSPKGRGGTEKEGGIIHKRSRKVMKFFLHFQQKVL